MRVPAHGSQGLPPRMSHRLGRRIAFAGFCLGVALLVPNLVGLVTPGQRYDTTPGEAPPAEVADLRSVEDVALRARASGVSGAREQAHVVQKLISARFAPCASRYTWGEDWIARALGLVWPDWDGHTPPALLRWSDCALCSQVADTYALVLAELGIPARVVSMPGHVVNEVEWDGAWHVVDPHFGYFPDDDGLSDSADDLARRPDILRARYEPLLPERAVAATLEAYAAFGAGEGRRGQPGRTASPRLLVMHQITAWLRWVIPLALIGGGRVCGRRRAPA